jgi:hypothetical protein
VIGSFWRAKLDSWTQPGRPPGSPPWLPGLWWLLVGGGQQLRTGRAFCHHDFLALPLTITASFLFMVDEQENLAYVNMMGGLLASSRALGRPPARPAGRQWLCGALARTAASH